MHRAVFLTWLVALLGLTGTAAFAVYIVQSEVVNPLQKFRGHILDVAEERCDRPIPYQDRTDEIGQMSRALADPAQRRQRAADTELGQGGDRDHHRVAAVLGEFHHLLGESVCRESRNL